MQCPVCKAENSQGPQCRRCRADLSLLFTLEEQRDQSLAAAHRCLVAGEWTQAIKHAESADWMRSDEDSRRLLAMAYLLNRDFAQAWHWYRSALQT